MGGAARQPAARNASRRAAVRRHAGRRARSRGPPGDARPGRLTAGEDFRTAPLNSAMRRASPVARDGPARGVGEPPRQRTRDGARGPARRPVPRPSATITRWADQPFTALTAGPCAELEVGARITRLDELVPRLRIRGRHVRNGRRMTSTMTSTIDASSGIRNTSETAAKASPKASVTTTLSPINASLAGAAPSSCSDERDHPDRDQRRPRATHRWPRP